MKVDVSVRDVMSTNVLKALPEDKVIDVVLKMREKNIGSAIVVSGGKVTGMVTERDLAFKMLPERRDPAQVSVREIMTSPVITISAETDLVGAAELMRRHKFRRLPVVDDRGTLVGIITQTDVADVGPELISLFKRLLTAKESGSDQISQYYQEKKAKEALEGIKRGKKI
ncbi:MAG: CBS domain-containing protein [archaeon]